MVKNYPLARVVQLFMAQQQQDRYEKDSKRRSSAFGRLGMQTLLQDQFLKKSVDHCGQSCSLFTSEGCTNLHPDHFKASVASTLYPERKLASVPVMLACQEGRSFLCSLSHGCQMSTKGGLLSLEHLLSRTLHPAGDLESLNSLVACTECLTLFGMDDPHAFGTDTQDIFYTGLKCHLPALNKAMGTLLQPEDMPRKLALVALKCSVSLLEPPKLFTF